MTSEKDEKEARASRQHKSQIQRLGSEGGAATGNGEQKSSAIMILGTGWKSVHGIV